jgi:hypothetical protein
MLPSAITLKYIKASNREGDNFNYEAWLCRVRAEEAAAKAVHTKPLLHDAHTTSRQIEASSGQPTKKSVLPPFPYRPSISAKRTQPHRRLVRPTPIREQLVRVSDAWDKFQDSRDRDGVYVFLKSVYSTVLDHQGNRRTRKLVRRAAEFSGLPLESNAEPFAAIIRCTSEQSVDIRTVSKWSRALRYAAYRKRAPRHLRRFIKRLGGINACADGYTKRLGRGVPRAK